MSNGNFDPQMDPAYFFGEFTNVKVIDPASPPIMVGNLVIDPTKDFYIDVGWTLKGFFVPVWLSALDNPPGKKWFVEAYADAMGPGQEIKIAEYLEPVGTYVQPKTYSVRLTVPANTLKEHSPAPGGPSGIYRLTISVFLDSKLGLPGYDIAGFYEGITIKAEKPK